MIIFPAIDIYEGKVVRLLKGDYNKMTIYSENVVDKACEIEGSRQDNLGDKGCYRQGFSRKNDR